MSIIDDVLRVQEIMLNTPRPEEYYRPFCQRCKRYLSYIYHIWWQCPECREWWEWDVENQWWEQNRHHMRRWNIEVTTNYE